MKSIFLLALAGVLTLSSFAAGNDRIKGAKKGKKAQKTEKVCPPCCSKGSDCTKL